MWRKGSSQQQRRKRADRQKQKRLQRRAKESTSLLHAPRSERRKAANEGLQAAWKDASILQRFPSLFRQAVDALSGNLWQPSLGEGNGPTCVSDAKQVDAPSGSLRQCSLEVCGGASEVKRPNLEAEVLSLAQQTRMQKQQAIEVQTLHGFSVGDAVQHNFKAGWVGAVIGFGPHQGVRVKWENDEAAELQYSEIGALGLSPFQHDYFVTLHLLERTQHGDKIRCTNMGGESVAVLENIHPAAEMADLLVELEKQLGAPQRLPGMPMRRLRLLHPDGREVLACKEIRH